MKENATSIPIPETQSLLLVGGERTPSSAPKESLNELEVINSATGVSTIIGVSLRSISSGPERTSLTEGWLLFSADPI